MRDIYEKISMEVEKFTANEYFASCGDSGVVYKFECDVGTKKRGDIFLDSNNNGILDWGDENLTPGRSHYFHSCGETHEAPTGDEFLKGFYVRNGGNDFKYGSTPVPVMVWTDGGTNVHATKNLKIEDWETLKS